MGPAWSPVLALGFGYTAGRMSSQAYGVCFNPNCGEPHTRGPHALCLRCRWAFRGGVWMGGLAGLAFLVLHLAAHAFAASR
jgi:hypothetical protein